MKTKKAVNTSEVVLKEIKKDDLIKIAQVHINSFPESALTKLGVSIIERYYLWQLTGPHEKVRPVGAFVGQNCAGFSFSGAFNGSTSGFINRNKMFLVKEVLTRPRLVFNSLFRRRLYSGVKLLWRFTKKKQSANAAVKTEKLKSYGILSIAVSTDYQKFGIGNMLMLDAENEAVKCGYKRMHLTVSPDNEKAIRFYEKLSWQKSAPDESWKGSMIKILD